MPEAACVWFQEELLECTNALVERPGHIGLTVEEDAVKDKVTQLASARFERIPDKLAV